MRFLPACLAAVVLSLTPAMAQNLPVVRAVAVTPDPSNRLAPQQSLYVRVAYASEQPLRFQARGYLQGRKNDRLMLNASAVFPAGKGEALVWLAGDAGARLDEIRVNVCDRNWQQLTEISVPVRAEWHAGLPAAPNAPWVKALSEAEQRMVSQEFTQPAPPTGWFHKLWSALATVFVPIAFLSVPGYPLLQCYAFVKLRGPARLLSALPLSFMLPIYAYCFYALSLHSNLWPLYAIFASPAALIITLAVVIVARRRRNTGLPTRGGLVPR